MSDSITDIILTCTIIAFFAVILFPMYAFLWSIFSIIIYAIIDSINIIYYRKYNSLLIKYPEFAFHKLTSRQELFLIQQFPFYQQLSAKDRTRFSSRVARFIKKKKFEGLEELKVTEEMKALIAASAIRLTFGYREYMLENFKIIIVYPSAYYSNMTHTYNKGEANFSGVIVFSWTDLLKGNETTTDRINLGYHEFAHALLYNENNTMTNITFRENIRKWRQLANSDSLLDKIRTNGIFREYAFTNEIEFFSVAVENFFEDPLNLKSKLPELYFVLSKLLNQDLAGNVLVYE